MKKPPDTDAGVLYQTRISHAALDKAVLTLKTKRLPQDITRETRKGLLLYQLRAYAELVPPSLLENSSVLAKCADIATLLQAAQDPNAYPPPKNGWAKFVRAELSHVRNEAHKQCGVVPTGEAWKHDDHALFESHHQALLKIGEQAYPFYLAQHLADRIWAIGTTMIKDTNDRGDMARLRHATHSAINQFREAYQPIRYNMPATDQAWLSEIDGYLHELAARPQEWYGTYAYLKKQIAEYDQKRFLRSDPNAPGVREESTLVSRLVDGYRDRRNQQPLQTVVMGESPLVEVAYIARWAKMTRAMSDCLHEPEAMALLNDTTLRGDPDSETVKLLVRDSNRQEIGRSWRP